MARKLSDPLLPQLLVPDDRSVHCSSPVLYRNEIVYLRHWVNEYMMQVVFFDKQSCLSFCRTVLSGGAAVLWSCPQNTSLPWKCCLSFYVYFCGIKRMEALLQMVRENSSTLINSNAFLANKTRKMYKLCWNNGKWCWEYERSKLGG